MDNRNVIFRSSCGANAQRIADDAVSDNVDPHNPIADVISYQSQLEKIRLKKEKRRLESENQSLKEEITCKQCHKHEIEMVFLPCGHVITCESCGTKARICFSCKQVIKGIAKFYSA
ncbi:hypothetical protein DPMN_138785 [Dreissena polymorpha]|uniref:RING-type domain-containing protein n=1 Tax=Dreissena polymorpha TaxID=45954 RepID=A0A9D4JIW6_DREPO|nr:hypothetical protein DPMN_138785 [Dreissena polymorpha]